MSTQLVRELTAAHLNGLKSSIHALEVQTTILKTLLTGTTTDDEETDTTTTENDSDVDTQPRKRAAKNTDTWDSDVTDDAESETEEDEDETPPAKAAKTKKVTSDDVNAACKARALRTTRAEVVGILKKKFKVKSVSELDPTDYATVIKAMKA